MEEKEQTTKTPGWYQRGYFQTAPHLDPFCDSAPPHPKKKKLNLDSTARRAEVGSLRSQDSVYRSLLTFHYRTLDKNVFLPCVASFVHAQALPRWGPACLVEEKRQLFGFASSAGQPHRSSFLGCTGWRVGLLQCPQGCLSSTRLEKQSLQLTGHSKNTILALALLGVAQSFPLCCGFQVNSIAKGNSIQAAALHLASETDQNFSFWYNQPPESPKQNQMKICMHPRLVWKVSALWCRSDNNSKLGKSSSDKAQRGHFHASICFPCSESIRDLLKDSIIPCSGAC